MAGIGLATGAGSYAQAVAVTAIVLARPERAMLWGRGHLLLGFGILDRLGALGRIGSPLGARGADIRDGSRVNTGGAAMPPGADAQIRVYASFERKRGGLLYVLQAALATLMYLLVRVLGPGLAGLAVSWGVYSLYFALRWPLWQRLYRREGHLEEKAALAEARSQLKFILWFLPALTLLLWRSPTVPLLPALFTVAGWVLVLARFGRLPIDVGMLMMALYASGTWSPMLPPGLWLLAVTICVTLGLWEHAVFVRACRRPGRPG